MQHTSNLVPTQQPAAQGEPSKAGPRPLHPSEFKFVSGGAPRNGWQALAPDAGTDKIAAPRNGW